MPSSEKDVVACNEPLAPLSCKLGLQVVCSLTDGGKTAQTNFIRLAYNADADSSLVLCRLFTGRTHQIRVHLQFLGFPIVDDPLYNSTDWGLLKGKGADYGISTDEIIQRISSRRSISSYISKQLEPGPDSSYLDAYRAELDGRPGLTDDVRQRLLAAFDEDCPDCRRQYVEPAPDHLVLLLHAYRYSGQDWSYSAPLPAWAIAAAGSHDLQQLIADKIDIL